MKNVRRGSSVVGIVVAIIVLIAAGGAAWYFLSDVGRSKMAAAYDQFAKWTPENIAKDPKGYLDFCEQQAKDAKANLKASQIRVAQNQAKITTQLEEAQRKVDAGMPVLGELKAGYKMALAEGIFPVTIRDTEFDQEALKQKIVKLHSEIGREKNLVAVAEQGLKTLEAQKNKIAAQQSACDEQLGLITVNRSKLEIQQITDDLKDQLVSMRSVLETAVAVSDDTDAFSLNAIAEQAATTVDDAEFEAILNE